LPNSSHQGDKKSDDLCKQVKTVIEAPVRYQSNSYT